MWWCIYGCSNCRYFVLGEVFVVVVGEVIMVMCPWVRYLWRCPFGAVMYPFVPGLWRACGCRDRDLPMCAVTGDVMV